MISKVALDTGFFDQSHSIRQQVLALNPSEASSAEHEAARIVLLTLIFVIFLRDLAPCLITASIPVNPEDSQK